MSTVRTPLLILALLLLASAQISLTRQTKRLAADQTTVPDTDLCGEADETDETVEADKPDEAGNIKTSEAGETLQSEDNVSQHPELKLASRDSSTESRRSTEPDIVAVFTVTAYTAHDPGMDGRGITSTGTKATYGRTIAVDPHLIPYGSRIYIPALKDWPNGGWFIAEDTGGAIKGYKLDIFIPNRKSALQFGRQRLEAHIYKPKNTE